MPASLRGGFSERLRTGSPLVSANVLRRKLPERGGKKAGGWHIPLECNLVGGQGEFRTPREGHWSHCYSTAGWKLLGQDSFLSRR